MEDCPVIDISKAGCEKDIHQALIQWGGFLVIGHGVDIELGSKMFEYASKFFNLPQKVKDSVHLRHGGAAWRGYMPYGGERSQSGTITDSKEGLYLGKEHPKTHSYVIAQFPTWGGNLLPDNELPGFRKLISEYVTELTKLGDKMMELISLSLGLPEDFIARNVTLDEPVVLPRIFNYPPKKTTAENEAVESWGIGEHTDYGLWTMILTNAAGLEVMHPRTKEMVQVPFLPDAFFMNAGDVLDRLTKGLYKSPRHRARNLSMDHSRISIPFFYDPAWTARMTHFPINNKHGDSDSVAIKRRWDGTKIRCEFDGSVEYSEFLAKKVA